VIASALSLVYRVEALDTNDGTWKYTSLLICSVVENYVAIIVSCAPGFAKFTRLYIAELGMIKSLRSSFTRSLGSAAVPTNKPLNDHKVEPRRPPVGRVPRELDDFEFDMLSDFTTKNSSSTNRHGDALDTRLTPGLQYPEIARSVGVPQTAHYPAFSPTNRRQEPRIQDFPNGIYRYGPNAGQPPAQSVWFYYVPSSNQEAQQLYDVSYGGPDNGTRPYAFNNQPSQTSIEGLVAQQPTGL
jgi:hypothetical protein